MGQQRAHRSGRRVGAGAITIAMLLGGGIVGVSAPVAAAVRPADQLCFAAAGNPGDAAIVNLTPVGASGSGNGQLISSDVKENPPVAANANFRPGSVDPNVAVTPIGTDGLACFQNSVHASVELVADHLGTVAASAYAPATSSGAPERKIDTRTIAYSQEVCSQHDGDGACTGWTAAAPAVRPIQRAARVCFTIAGNSGDAAIVNLTPVEASGNGNGQLISSDVKADPPLAANVNFRPGSVDPNVAVTPIGADGQVCFQNSRHSTVHLIADHLGTIDASAYAPALASGAPARRVDTRIGQGGNRIQPSGQLCFAVTGNPGDAAIVNLTPVGASGNGNGQLISSNVKSDPPVAANTNFGPGSVDPNVAVAPIGSDGQVCFQNSTHASVDLAADHLGSIAGSSYTAAKSTGAPDRRVDTRIDLVKMAPRCAENRSSGYSTPTARIMFGLSSRAYEVEPGVAKKDERLDQIGSGTVHFPAQMSCWTLVAALRGNHGLLGAVTDTEVIVARNVETHDLAVSFRGTEADVADILTDIASTRVSWRLPNGQLVSNAVHGGFAGAYLAVRDQLLAVLDDAEHGQIPGARVYFTGHSLGGALASLASIDLVDDLMEHGYARDEVVTYTFGAPRSMSQEMAGYHASFVPESFAVANPMDPVPQLPTAVGSNPFSHLRQMTSLVGILTDPRVRVDRGDGRDYRGCLNSLPSVSNFLLFHARDRYALRVGATQYVGAPTVWITIAGGENRLNWNSPLEGPCDWVGLWRTSGTLTNPNNPIRDRNVLIDTNDIHTTTVGKGDNYWIGYVNMFGDLISTREYFPATPSTLRMVRNENLLTPDTIDFEWTISDAGDHDIVVLYDRNPWTAGVNGWYDHPIWSRVDANGNDADGYQKMNISIGSNPNKWWVAYIMVDDDGNQRILAASQGVRG